MKLFKNKIFLIIVSFIIILFSLQFYFISNSFTRDTNSYVTIIKGAGFLTTGGEKKILKINEKQKISSGDVIQTLGNSLAVIEWGDKSITRLGENSKIIVKEDFVSDNLGEINICFELLKGKTWSNIISILYGNSYFKQELKGISASVRGTVFEVNYDSDYVIVHDHELEVTSTSGISIKIYPGDIFSLENFSIIEDIKTSIDETFQKLNETMDEEYLEKLRGDFLQVMNEANPLNLIKNLQTENTIISILNSQKGKELTEYIANLSEKEKEKALSYLETLNQSLNFENGEDEILYKIKLNLKNTLIKFSQDEEFNKILLKYSLYDLSEQLSFENFKEDVLDNTLSLFVENKNLIDNISQESSRLFGETNEKLENTISKIKSGEISLKDVTNKVIDINEKGQNFVIKFLNKLFGISEDSNEE